MNTASTVKIRHKDDIDNSVGKSDPVRGMYDNVNNQSSSPPGHFRIKQPGMGMTSTQKVVEFKLAEADRDQATFRFLNSGDDPITIMVGGSNIEIKPQESRDVSVTGRQDITVKTDVGKAAKGIYELTELRTQ